VFSWQATASRSIGDHFLLAVADAIVGENDTGNNETTGISTS